MTEEQYDILKEWFMNLIVEYRLDYFRGNAFSNALHAFARKSPWTHEEALHYCQEAESRNVRIRTNDYDELVKELYEIAKEVPLNNTIISAVTYIFRGEWKDAISYIKEIEVIICK
jgi:hypothetical protein|nr:MAG TPA: hypothetical protein [Bacteriophage sp.]